MKIKQVVKAKKGPEEIYNDGNNINAEEKDIVKHVEYNRDNETSLYIKPSIKKNTNIDKSSFPANIHKEIKVDTIDGTAYKYSIDGDVDIKKGSLQENPSVANRDIIKSKIDGMLDWTNVQDTNLSWESGKGAGENWGDLGQNIAKQATGALGNMLGFSNTNLSDFAGAVNSFADTSLTKYDEDISKLNEWKQKKFKEIHVQDWKPGQTLIPDLLGGTLGNTIEGVGNSSLFKQESRNKFNKVYSSLKEIISPDPVKTIRDAIKPTKGITEDAETINVQKNTYNVEYVSPEGTNTVSFKWSDDTNFFSELNKSEKEIRIINALKNKNTFNKTLGSIYIRPNFLYQNENGAEIDEGGVGILEIPFEFNPTISEGGTQANYAVENLMNRIGQFHIYTGTNLSTLSIELSYMALAPDYLDSEDKRNISKQFSTDSWQYYWTNNRIEEIEYKLRSLVMPDVVSSDYLIRPPLIEIHLGNPNGEGADSVGDLFKYPVDIYNNDTQNLQKSIEEEKKYLATSKTILKNENANRYKKYIVTSVQISNFNDDSFVWPSLYGRVWDSSKSGSPVNHIKTAQDLVRNNSETGFNGYTRRTGFKASLQCTEVTENFLDIVPDFKAYYNAWNFKGNKANEMSKYVKYVMNEKIEETTDYLNGAINAVAASISNINDRLDAAFNEAYSFVKVYKDLVNKNSRSNAFSCQAISKENLLNPRMDDYYFANPKWISKFINDESIYISEEMSSEEEKEHFNKPIYFEVEMKSDLNNFLPEAKLNWETYMDQKFDQNFTVDNTSISTSDNKLIRENDIAKMQNTLDEEYINYLDLGDQGKPKEILVFNDDLEKKKYSDAECIVLIMHLRNVFNFYFKEANNVSDIMPSLEHEIEAIKEKLKLEISKANNIPVEETEADPIFEKTQINELFENMFVFDYTQKVSELLLILIENVKNAVKDESKQKTIINLINEKINIEYCIETIFSSDNTKIYNDKNTFEYLVFDEIYKEMESAGVSLLKTISIFGNIKNTLFNFYNLSKEISDAAYIIVIDFYESIKSSLTEFSLSVCESLLFGKNMKSIYQDKRRIICKGKKSDNKSIDFFNKEIIMYDCQKSDYKLFNIKYIYDKIIDSYSKSIKNISSLKAEMNKSQAVKADNKILEIYKKIENIQLNKISELDFSSFSSKNIKEYLDNKIEFYNKSYNDLIFNVANLKQLVRKIKVQEEFCKIAGYDEKTINNLKKSNPSKVYKKIDKLKSLEDAYEEYSESIDKIKEIYEDFDKAIVDENSSIDLEEYNDIEESGKIPNLYFQINEATKIENNMQVAGSSMKGFNKLSV